MMLLVPLRCSVSCYCVIAFSVIVEKMKNFGSCMT